MEIAKYLDDSPQHLVQVDVKSSKTEVAKRVDDHRLWRKGVAHMLNAIVFELAIKVIWEVDNNRECDYTHNIFKLYDQLNSKSRQDISEIYDFKLKPLVELEGTKKDGQRIRMSDLVCFQTLQEALSANEETMKNFKYDSDFSGKSSAMGSVVWSEKLLYAFPPLKGERLPEALYKYTLNRVNGFKP